MGKGRGTFELVSGPTDPWNAKPSLPLVPKHCASAWRSRLSALETWVFASSLQLFRIEDSLLACCLRGLFLSFFFFFTLPLLNLGLWRCRGLCKHMSFVRSCGPSQLARSLLGACSANKRKPRSETTGAGAP